MFGWRLNCDKHVDVISDSKDATNASNRNSSNGRLLNKISQEL